MTELKTIVAPEPNRVILETTSIDENALPADHLLVKTDYSVISPGTECAWISGNSNNDGQTFPFYPGYSAAGHVVKVGTAVKDYQVGDRVIVPWGGHRSYTMTPAVHHKRGAHRIKDERISSKDAALCHIACFPMLGVRRLMIQMGEPVMIAGLGLLGQVALQAARLCGAVPLLACDFSQERRELALKLGADAVFDPRDPDFLEQVKAASGGAGVAAVVEVTGFAAALQQALQYTAKMGRVSLLGCTRVPDCEIDFYRDVHLKGVTLIGAHTSNRPRNDSGVGAWSEQDDYEAILKFLGSGRFQFSPLLTKTVSPEDCSGVYDMLLHQKNPPLGIVFDWTKIS